MKSHSAHESSVWLKPPLPVFKDDLEFELQKIDNHYWYILKAPICRELSYQLNKAYNTIFNCCDFQTKSKVSMFPADKLKKMKQECPEWFIDLEIKNEKYQKEVWLKSPLYKERPILFKLHSEKDKPILFYLSALELNISQLNYVIQCYKEKIEQGFFNRFKDQIKIRYSDMQQIHMQYPKWVTTTPINLEVSAAPTFNLGDQNNYPADNSESNIQGETFTTETTLNYFNQVKNPITQMNLADFLKTTNLSYNAPIKPSQEQMPENFNEEDFYNMLKEIPGIIEPKNESVDSVQSVYSTPVSQNNLSFFPVNQTLSNENFNDMQNQNNQNNLDLFNFEFNPDEEQALEELSLFIQKQEPKENEIGERPFKFQKK